MRLIGVYIGSFLALLLGCGAFIFSDPTDHQEAFDEVMLCEARGGAWVHDAAVPLCMTPEDGLLELVDGSFIAYTSTDPWEQSYISPLEGKELQPTNVQEAEEIKGQEEEEKEYQAAQRITACEEEKMEEYEGRIADVDFSSWPEAEKYRTAIRRDVDRGVNFAGSYIVSTWGCARRKSDACVGHAIIDTQTGEIVLYGIIGRRTAEFSIESNIFSITLQDGEEKTWSIEDDELISCEK